MSNFDTVHFFFFENILWAESEAGERWLSGMVEVELPVEYKLKNIEETEAAKAALLAPKTSEKSLLHIPR